MKLVREHIYEEFREQSDPIEDMGIGLTFPEKLLEWSLILFGNRSIVRKMTPQEASRYKHIGDMYDIRTFLHLSSEDWKLLREKIGKPIPKEYKAPGHIYGMGKDHTMLNYLRIISDIYDGEIVNKWSYESEKLLRSNKVIIDLYGKPGFTYKKLIEYIKKHTEKLDEAFTESGDPISDMGIGGYTWKTLKPGAIIKPKKLGIAVTKNRSGHFSSWHTGLRLQPENVLLVTEVIPITLAIVDIKSEKSVEKKEIQFKQLYDTEEMKDVREKFRTKEFGWAFGTTNGRMIVSEKQFDNRFNVIEKGFS